MKFRGTLQDIRLFVAAYEEGSFTAAGQRENTAQSGVSQHIRSLEDAYGVRLFFREAARVVPTPAADVFYQRCVVALRELFDGAGELRRFRDEHVEHIRAGVFYAVNRRLTASALLKFEAAYPNAKVTIHEGMSPQFPDLVKSGELDFAICVPINDDRGIRTSAFLPVTYCLLARAKPYDHNAVMREFPTEPLKICWPTGAYGRREILRQGLIAEGLTIAQEREIDSPFATLDLVCRSEWVAIAPSFVFDPQADSGRYSIRPLRKIVGDSDIALMESKSSVLSPAARAYLDCLEQVHSSSNEDWSSRFAQIGV